MLWGLGGLTMLAYWGALIVGLAARGETPRCTENGDARG